MPSRISEFDILVPTAEWLVKQGCMEMKVSIARGQGRPIKEQEHELRKCLEVQGFTKISFTPNGPDIVARFSNHIWKIECKGFSNSSRKAAPARARFYEAFAQAVSYYNEPDPEGRSNLASVFNVIEDKDEPIRLGLALPRVSQYLRLFRKVVNPSLRRRLNLWLFIVDAETKSVECYDPCREI